MYIRIYLIKRSTDLSKKLTINLLLFFISSSLLSSCGTRVNKRSGNNYKHSINIDECNPYKLLASNYLEESKKYIESNPSDRALNNFSTTLAKTPKKNLSTLFELIEEEKINKLSQSIASQNSSPQSSDNQFKFHKLEFLTGIALIATSLFILSKKVSHIVKANYYAIRSQWDKAAAAARKGNDISFARYAQAVHTMETPKFSYVERSSAQRVLLEKVAEFRKSGDSLSADNLQKYVTQRQRQATEQKIAKYKSQNKSTDIPSKIVNDYNIGTMRLLSATLLLGDIKGESSLDKASRIQNSIDELEEARQTFNDLQRTAKTEYDVGNKQTIPFKESEAISESFKQAYLSEEIRKVDWQQFKAEVKSRIKQNNKAKAIIASTSATVGALAALKSGSPMIGVAASLGINSVVNKAYNTLAQEGYILDQTSLLDEATLANFESQRQKIRNKAEEYAKIKTAELLKTPLHFNEIYQESGFLRKEVDRILIDLGNEAGKIYMAEGNYRQAASVYAAAAEAARPKTYMLPTTRGDKKYHGIASFIGKAAAEHYLKAGEAYQKTASALLKEAESIITQNPKAAPLAQRKIIEAVKYMDHATSKSREGLRRSGTGINFNADYNQFLKELSLQEISLNKMIKSTHGEVRATIEFRKAEILGKVGAHLLDDVIHNNLKLNKGSKNQGILKRAAASYDAAAKVHPIEDGSQSLRRRIAFHAQETYKKKAKSLAQVSQGTGATPITRSYDPRFDPQLSDLHVKTAETNVRPLRPGASTGTFLGYDSLFVMMGNAALGSFLTYDAFQLSNDSEASNSEKKFANNITRNFEALKCLKTAKKKACMTKFKDILECQ